MKDWISKSVKKIKDNYLKYTTHLSCWMFPLFFIFCLTVKIPVDQIMFVILI